MITDEMVEAFGMTFFSVNPITNTERRKEDIRAALEAALAAMPKPEPIEIHWPEYHYSGMGCGLEDRGIRDRYDAMRYGWDCAVECCMEAVPEDPLYTTPPAPAVSVKALEWNAEANGDFIAQSAVGWYHIGFPARSWNLTTPSGDVPSFEILEYAKAAAQRDYEARILSALNTSPEAPRHD